MNVFERLLPRVGDTMLGRFRLESELGRGGFGVVFKAKQTSLNQTVAIKVLLPHILSNRELVERFSREVAVARDLQHPNTIRIIDYDKTDEGIPFYVMEFVTGQPLVDDIREKGGMPESRAKRIVTQILKSLGEAHSIGIVHRDLKPANVMLCNIFGEHDFVKVLDFGIAKALTGLDGATTKTGMLLGSPPYMSPEQAKAMKDLDGRSDLYSVGLILAECLTGMQVVQVSELGQVLALHLSEDGLPFAPRVVNSPLWPVIERATHKDRNLRHRDATEMRTHLESIEVPEGFFPVQGGSQPHGQGAGPSPTPSAVYGTPHPSLVQSQQAQFTPQPSGVPHSATPQPSPHSGQFTPPPEVTSDPQSGRMYVPGARIADPSDGTAEVTPKKKRGLSPLVIALVLLILGGGAAFLVIGPGGPSESSGETVVVPTDDNESTETDDPGEATETDDPTGPATDHVAAVTDNDDREPADQDRVSATAGIALAQAEVHAGLPDLHQIRFTGMSDVLVRYGDAVLGVTPFPIQVPNASRQIELTFEREGYRTVQMTVSLARRDPIEVELRRVREREREREREAEPTATAEDTQETEEEEETEPAFVIPEVTIH